MIQIKELLSLDNRKKCSIINSMNMKEILTKYKWEFKEQGRGMFHFRKQSIP